MLNLHGEQISDIIGPITTSDIFGSQVRGPPRLIYKFTLDNQILIMSNSTIIKDVPSRARNIEQILDFANKHSISNEMLIKVGLRINANLINNRCVAMLIVFKSLLDNPREKTLSELQQSFKLALDFLDFCRPLSISMTNAYEAVKKEINKARLNQGEHPESSDLYEEQKQNLKKFIDQFIDEEIWAAQKGICENINNNIATNDVILVYGCSTIVQHVLSHAKSEGKVFKVIVVDSPPLFNGRRMTSFLNDISIDVSYTLISSLSYVIRKATKVLLGANSILANGYVMSQIGTSQVSLMAKAANVPTLVCCETYKLSDRVHVDSFGCNEVDSHELGAALNLRYDMTPPEFVSMVINEKSTVPAESVPALLRFRAEKTGNSLFIT